MRDGKETFPLAEEELVVGAETATDGRVSSLKPSGVGFADANSVQAKSSGGAARPSPRAHPVKAKVRASAATEYR
ncbi:hypothetical protein ACCS68_33990 [Rhizobium beringeri]|uniref:hypothetical protein n=1 Tax=Rhizobium TaxID=379 RepID=UPI0010309290|nr:hypothetical protein [Rhizobium leguminosarum]TAW53237.1 hypothetical protein ELI14_18985 [Rhizobium leguminosarum]